MTIFKVQNVVLTQPGDNINSKEDNGDLESCFNATVDYDIPPVQDEGLSKNNDLYCHAQSGLGDDE
jgi:hypothetical protein